MKTAVVFKWTRDPQDARISVDGSLVWGNAKMAPCDDDPAVMEIAKTLAGEDEILAVTIGNGDSAWAAARGAASTVIVKDVEDLADATVTASIIAEALRQNGDFEAVVIGDSDWNAGVVVGLIAEMGLPAFAGVVAAEAAGDAYRLSCKSGATTKIVEARPPFLIGVKGLTSEKSAPGMKQVLQARKKPQTALEDAALLNVKASCAEEAGVRLPDRGSITMIDGSDPAAAARELVQELKRGNIL